MKTYLISIILILCACKAPRNQQNSALLDSDSLDIPEEPDEFPHIDFRRGVKADILGIPFGDTVLNEFRTDRNLGVNNIWLQDDFVLRFAHLAEQHGRDLERMGFESCYDFKAPRNTHDYRDKQSGPKLFNATALPRVTKDLYRARHCFLQRVNFPESYEWRTSRTPANKKPPRVITLFMPNVLTVHLDTNGTWPFGRRPNDDMIGRFNGLFLNMGDKPGDCSGNQDVEALTKQGKSPDASSLSSDEKCSLVTLSRPSAGSHVAQFKGWKSNTPAIPLNPPHKITYANGQTKEGFDEEVFPFLEPPNKGRGYYQEVPASREFHAWNYQLVKRSAKAFAVKSYKAKDPTLRFHPYCDKEGGVIRGEWKANSEAKGACEDESVGRFGISGRVIQPTDSNVSEVGKAAFSFYGVCENFMDAQCKGVDLDRLVY